MVELVIPGVNDAARRCVEDDGDAIGNGVSHPDERNPERAELSRRIVGMDLTQLGRAQQPMLVELRLDETEREPCRPHLRDAHLAHEVGQAADVVLVRVREDDGANVRSAISEVRVVGQDEIHSEVLVAREREPRVDDDDRAFGLVGSHVLPHLAEAAEGNDAADAHRSYAWTGWSTPARSRQARTCASSWSVGSTIGRR